MRTKTALLRHLLKEGFTLVRQTNHAIFRCPCGHQQISLSLTHQEGRSDQNDRALIARVLRECEENQKVRPAA
jgi:hypothetical protein